MTRYVTAKMIAKHVGINPKAVLANLKRFNVPFEMPARKIGIRVTERNANTFILKRWPEAGPMGEPANNPTRG